MPLYDYQCDHCQSVFEVRLTFKEKDAGLQPVCPRCQTTKTHQLLATGLFVLQGHDGSSTRASGCGSGCGGSCASCGH